MLREDDFGLLRLLVSTQFGNEPETVDGLVRKLGVSQSFVSQRLRRLQKEGYLDRPRRALHSAPSSPRGMDFPRRARGRPLVGQG
jgi:predicted transcriptional regulator